MEHVGRPLDFVEINDIVVQNGVVKAFDFCLAFPDLIESGHIRREETETGELFSVTQLGREAQADLGGKILNVTKEKALENAILYLNLKKMDAGYRYRTTSLPGGKFLFSLHFSRGSEDVISVSVVTENKKDAENMEVEFERHPDMVRRGLLALLTNNAQAIIEYDPMKLKD